MHVFGRLLFGSMRVRSPSPFTVQISDGATTGYNWWNISHFSLHTTVTYGPIWPILCPYGPYYDHHTMEAAPWLAAFNFIPAWWNHLQGQILGSNWWGSRGAKRCSPGSVLLRCAGSRAFQGWFSGLIFLSLKVLGPHPCTYGLGPEEMMLEVFFKTCAPCNASVSPGGKHPWDWSGWGLRVLCLSIVRTC